MRDKMSVKIVSNVSAVLTNEADAVPLAKATIIEFAQLWHLAIS